MAPKILFGVTLSAWVISYLIALRLRRYRLRWHLSLWNLEFYRPSNYTPAGRPWLIADVIALLVGAVAWFTLIFKAWGS